MKKIMVAIAMVATFVASTAELKLRPTYDGVTYDRVTYDGVAHAQSLATPAAAAWVAFDATFVRTEPGRRRVVGWFHRGADGSTREESNVDGPSHPVILILNVARELQYRFEDDVWSSYLAYLPPGGLHPQNIDRDPRKYTVAPPIEQIPVFRFVDAQGVLLFVAPSLNNFSLKTERPSGGRESFSNLFVRDQPAGLFEPPPGAAVHVHEIFR